NLDSKKFLMYPRFLQLFLNNQLKDLPEPFNDTYDTPSHTKKVFSNMARQSKGFSGKVTPLFDSMLVQNHAPEGEGSAIPPEPQPTPSISQPNVLEPQTALLQTETPPTVSYEPQTEAHIEQILLSPSTYHRKHRKTQKHRRAKKTRSERVLEKPNEPPLPEGHTSGSGEGNMEHTFELMDTVLPIPYDSPLTGGYTLGSNEGRLKLKELMAICTKLSKQVLDLEKEKDAQAVEILKLKQRVESSDDDLDEEDASKQGRDSDKTKSMFQDSDFDVLDDDIEVVKRETVHTATTGVSVVSAPVTTAGVAIIKMRSEKSKVKGVAFRDVEETHTLTRSTTTLQPLPTIDPKDKGNGVLVEEEPEKLEKVKRKDQGLAQIESDTELAQRLHEEELAELDKAQKERQKQEETTSANLAEEFNEIQARIDVDHELVIRLTHEEQEKYTIE
ncbi:hypothetical protein Tco_0987555, partial [Tanacetum coccineum]